MQSMSNWGGDRGGSILGGGDYRINSSFRFLSHYPYIALSEGFGPKFMAQDAGFQELRARKLGFRIRQA